MAILRIYQRRPALDAALVGRFQHVPAATVSDALGPGWGAVGLGLIAGSLPADHDRSVAGRALTVKTRPGDNLAVHKAIDRAAAGDVLVVDARGDLECSVMGELMTMYAHSRGVAAIVIDGAVRDVAHLSKGTVPVYARGICHIGPQKHGPGQLHGQVSIGGVVVCEGDLVVADHDGVTVVPRHRIDETILEAERIVAVEDGARRAILAGTWDRSWIDGAATVVQLDRALSD